MLQKDTESPLTERQLKMVDEAFKACTRLVALVAELSEVGKLDNNTAAVKTTVADVTLTVTRQGASVVVSWPATASGFILESCNTFPGVTWNNLGGGTPSGGQNRVTVGVVPGQKVFFRLRRP